MMVRFARQGGMRKETKRAKSIIQAHQHDPPASQTVAIVDILGTCTENVPAAGNPDHHRLARSARPFWSPDVEEKAILFGDRVWRCKSRILRANHAEFCRIPHACPG